MPKEGLKHKSEEDAPEFEVPNVYYRPLPDVILAVFQSPEAAGYHYVPFKQFWRPPSSPEPSQGQTSAPEAAAGPSTARTGCSRDPGDIRIRSEYYNVDAMLDEDASMRRQPRQAGNPSTLEYFIAGLCLWLDSMHLAQFGSTSLWPIYTYICNESKYTHGRPTSFSAQHVAYVPSVCTSLFLVAMTDLIVFTSAPQLVSRLVHQDVQNHRHCCHPHVLQARTHASSLESTPEPRVHQGIHLWHHSDMRRRDHATYVHPNPHLFSRLPGEVSAMSISFELSCANMFLECFLRA